MKRDNINYIASGTVVLLALGLLLLVLFKITGRSGDNDTYALFYERVAGLSYGTPVYYEGYSIGQVLKVIPEQEGSQTRFRVEIGIAEGWPIPEDSVAEIASAGLLSDVFVVIKEGQSDQVLNPGSVMKSQEAADLFGAFSDLAGKVSNLTDDEINPLLSLLNERLEHITGDLESSTPLIVKEIEQMVTRLNSSAGAIEELLNEKNRSHVSQILVNVEDMSASAATLAEELNLSRQQLDEILVGMNGLLTSSKPDVERTVAELRLSAEELSKRLENIGFNLDQASRNFNEFTRAIRNSPNRLLFTPEQDDLETER